MKYKYRYQELYKDVKIDVKSNSRNELLVKVQRKKDKIDKQTVDAQMRLTDFCDLYLETYKRPTVSASWYNDLYYISRKIVDGIGDKSVGKITPIEVQSFLNSCSCLSDSTIKKVYDLTKQIFAHLERNGATGYRFDLTLPKGKTSKIGKSLTVKEQQALLKVIKGHRGELFILLMYYCGIRPAEVSALTWNDIDLKQNILTVRQAVKKDGSIGPPKSLAGVREIPIPCNLSTILQNTVKSSIFVCYQRNGHHTKSSIRKLWQDIKKDLDNEVGYETNIRLYDIRHTYCTNLEKSGVPINIASRLLGHSDISITSKVYTHASSEAVEIARRCIEGNIQELHDAVVEK